MNGLRRADYVLLVLICAALYGWAAFSDRPLSIHEARLPQLAREMAQGKSDWLLPQSGGRPWLERPPLPHCFTAISMLIFQADDSAWVARIPVAMMGCLIVLMGAWIAAHYFGRDLGLLAGVVLATCYEVYQYSCQAEDDIYLGALAAVCMVMFVKAEGSGGRGQGSGLLRSFASSRPWPVVLVFFFLGLTNWAKGPLVGALPLIGAMAAYLLWNRDWRRLRQYVWLWGWLIFAGLTIAWPWLAMKKYPDVWDNWLFDYAGQSDSRAAEAWNEPFWYYLKMLPMAVAPWTWATVIGLAVTARRAWTVRQSPERLLWCWAVVGLLILSLPARKHHHYLVPIIAPWAILSALGLVPVGQFFFAGHGPEWTRRPWFGLLVAGLPGTAAILLLRHRIPGPSPAAILFSLVWIICVWIFYEGLARRNARLLVEAFLLGFVVIAGWLQSFYVGRDPATLADVKFLNDIRNGAPLMVNAMIGDLEFFRLQFYLRDDTRLLHNLSYLRDENLRAPAVYVVTRARDQEKLKQLGDVQIAAQSGRTYGSASAGDRFTLFQVTFRPDLARYPLPAHVGVMQAMERKKGPWCGDHEF